MKRILLVTHGNFAQGIKQSLEVVVGTSEGVETITIQKDTTREQVEKDFSQFKEKINSEDRVFVVTDILAGSTSQYTSEFMKDVENTTLISGLNLGLLLELFVTEDLNSSQVDIIIEAAKSSIQPIESFENNVDEI